MKDNFCDYETSKMLKELGFDEICSHVHSIGKNEGVDPYPFDYIPKKDDTLLFVKAPLWQQAKRWLWEKYIISMEVECISISQKLFKLRIYQFIAGDNYLIKYLHFNDPIECETEGIKAAVKYLWENKQK